MNTNSKVWLVTGCSTGFGREIALAALRGGACVAVTARRPEAVVDICDAYPDTAIALPLDVTDAGERDEALQSTLDRFGRIDVLVNNAGYGYVAAVEEGEEDEVRAMFETNFFATLALTQAALPIFRRQGGGRIINNSSQAGVMANPGTGFYSASKYALEGLMEALTKEVASLGIQVVTVQPGAFRTDWSGRSMRRSQRRIDDYAESVGARLDMIAAIDGKQPGDPRRAAEVFWELGNMDNPPAQLVLGAGLLASLREKIAATGQRLDEWESVSISAEYPQE